VRPREKARCPARAVRPLGAAQWAGP
jgi:hypothetical protein